MQKAGYLMPVASLPCKYGIGDFGNDAFEFVDIMQESGIKIWQILPLNPVGYGNSPYQPYSSFAGDEIYISIDKLIESNLLSKRDVDTAIFSDEKIEYDKVRKNKTIYLKKSFKNFKQSGLKDDFNDFVEKNKWVYDFGVFLALKKHNNLLCWIDWPAEQKNWIVDKKFDVTPYEDDIKYEMYIQYIFFSQWNQLRRYANQKGVLIMGDIPIYVGIDSLDVWANQECFLLDANKVPTYVAGVPPDGFSKEGQRWGNPLYDWEYIEKNNFMFWLERIGGNINLFDILRIDHFRAFDTYWKIPASCQTAIEGEWIEAPGYALFDAIFEKFPHANIVAEDLGDLRPQVLELRDHYNFKGMLILQYVVDPNVDNSEQLKIKNAIMYTGTHDNNTIKGWYENLANDVKKAVDQNFIDKGYAGSISENMVSLCFSSLAEFAIVPVQDVLGLGDEARVNSPGTVGSPNWEWKLKNFDALKQKTQFIRSIVEKNNR